MYAPARNTPGIAGANHTTIVGNLVKDPELRFTNTGIAVANLRVAVTQRVQQDGTWRDGDTSFLKVNVNSARRRPAKEAHRRALDRPDRLLRSEAERARLRRGDPTQRNDRRLPPPRQQDQKYPLTCGFGARGGIRTLDLPIGIRRPQPLEVGWQPEDT